MFFTLLVFVELTFNSTGKAHGLKYHEFRPIDHRLGMNASAVNCIVQDGQGLIWMGTDRGLYSFDGYLARQYSAREEPGTGQRCRCLLCTDD